MCSGNTGPLIKTILRQIGKDLSSVDQKASKKVLKEKIDFMKQRENRVKSAKSAMKGMFFIDIILLNL